MHRKKGGTRCQAGRHGAGGRGATDRGRRCARTQLYAAWHQRGGLCAAGGCAFLQGELALVTKCASPITLWWLNSMALLACNMPMEVSQGAADREKSFLALLP